MKKTCLVYILFLLLFLSLPLVPVVLKVHGETLSEFYSRPGVEQEAIKVAARGAGMTLEEFLVMINPPAEEGTLNLNILFIGVSLVISVGSLVAASVLWRRQSKVEEKLESLVARRDDLRREHLKKLQKLVESYFAKEGRYPNQEEFEAIRGRTMPLMLDPLEGQERKEGGRYSYFYSQHHPDGAIVDQLYYRLWCFVEGEDSKETVGGKLVVEP
ncbi:superinfection exclusion B family protein [Patescibacteria group bacterium]|nr:superinfection exclusion B family protein [Patescibacteria group bacterium]MBU1868753.1 superinfection exclusion B family protein [Patescibacteria group bacterium]